MDHNKGSIGLVNLLIHRRTAVILLLCLLLFTLIGAIVPQQGVVPADYLAGWQTAHPYLTPILKGTGLFAIKKSFLFIAIVSWLLISVSLCTARRIYHFRRPSPPALDMARPLASFPVTGKTDQKILIRIVKRHGYRLTDPKQKIFRAGHDGRLGSYLFHASFVILLIGCLATVWGKSQKTVILTEGQTWQGVIPPPRMALIIKEKKTPLTLRLKKFSPAGSLPEKSVLAVKQNSREREISISPFQAKNLFGYTFYQQDHGFSPLISLKRGGEIIFQGFIALKSGITAGKPEYRDAVVIGSPPLILTLNLFPDYNNDPANPGTISRHPEAPALAVSLSPSGNDFRRRIIAIGDKKKFDDFQLRFAGLKYWSEIKIVRDPGSTIIFTAFIVGILGLLFRLTGRVRWLRMTFTTDAAAGKILTISYSCRHEPYLERHRLYRMADEIKIYLEN